MIKISIVFFNHVSYKSSETPAKLDAALKKRDLEGKICENDDMTRLIGVKQSTSMPSRRPTQRSATRP